MPEDKRPFIVVTDEMPEHPKVEALSDKAFRTLITLWCRSHRLDTDGQVSAVQWRKVPAKIRAELIDAPLVTENADGSVQMRDYLDHNQSSAQREAGREKKRAAGAKGGAAKAAALAGALAGATAPASQMPKHVPSKDVAEGEGRGRTPPEGTLPRPAHLTVVAEQSAATVVAAYVEGATDSGRDRPSARLVGKVGRDAKRLIAAGTPVESVVDAARRCGSTGWDDLDRELQRPQRGKPLSPAQVSRPDADYENERGIFGSTA